MSKIFEQLMRVRGIGEDFLHPKYEKLSKPENLPDIDKAVERLNTAKERKEKVLIYGDYDVDGVTATTILYETLKLMGIAEVETMLPDRFKDGYGMSRRLVSRAKETGVSLVVTVDCGSNNGEIVEELNKAAVDVIVTDHHEIAGELPQAVAVVSPKREDFRRKVLDRQAQIVANKEKLVDFSGLGELSGAGVAFMLAVALKNAGLIPEGQEKWLLDLAMIGTICDAMILTKDNRIICKYGAVVLSKTKRPGLMELMRVAGMNKINTEGIGFQLGPRLNAAGRMETAEIALNLLKTKSKVKAARYAEDLNRLNAERRAQQNRAMEELASSGVGEEPVIVVKGNYGEGIVGIIAGRITEQYKRPSFVLTEVDGVLKGSGRSFGEFNLAEALKNCSEILLSGGGHAAACGMSIKQENFEEFKERVNGYYRSLGLKNQERFLDVKEDISVSELDKLNLELMEEIAQLEPFGEGNPEPIFLLPDMFVQDAGTIGINGKHLRILIRDDNGKTMKLVAFNAPKEWTEVRPGARVSVFTVLSENEWQGTRSVEGRILKLRVEM
ncbi:DHH family phosphoesterase [Candidatus Saccharibacteria bacterium]|nr:DHH family phosphoesterase [Candidatus Saccharibacteria bacterium]